MIANLIVWMSLQAPPQVLENSEALVEQATTNIIEQWTRNRPTDFPLEQLPVSNTGELYAALRQANKRGFTEIILQDGIYHLAQTLIVEGTMITLRSASGDRNKVILRGPGMNPAGEAHNLIRVTGAGFRFSGITGEQAPNHIIQIVGEADADSITLENCRLQDSGEQLLKVSVSNNNHNSSDYGHVNNCIFAFTAGIGPQHYIGGIDAHRARYWLVENNDFWSIASPSDRVAQFAIHFWNESAHNLVRNNLVVNSDRGIGFGLGKNTNIGGVIRDNTIVSYDEQHPFNDAGIVLEASSFSIVYGNDVVLKTNYPRAIELRREGTRYSLVAGNRVNRAISEVQGAEGTIKDNTWSDQHKPIEQLIERLPAEFKSN